MELTWFSISSMILAIVVSAAGPGHGKLVLLQTLFRHGDRAPTHQYKHDPNNHDDIWPEGMGKLTQRGKKQQYELGKQLRSLYSDFITSNPNEVYVNSTSIDRCLRSAESHLAGLYAPTPDWQFTPDLKWQPIPIHYLHQHVDKYLNPTVKCHKAKKEAKKIFNSDYFKNIYEGYKPMVKNLSECLNEDMSLKHLKNLQNTVQIEMEYDFPVPPCVVPYMDELTELANIIHFIIYQSPIIQKLRAGPLLGKMVDDMNKKLSGDLPDLKVHVYSGRDRSLVAVMQALGIYNYQKPSYCQTLLIELHQSDDDSASVRFLLMNSTRPQDGDQTPHLLTMKGCGEFCPLEHFLNITTPLVPDDFDKECDNS